MGALAEAKPIRMAMSASPASTHRILLVEDQVDIANALSEHLRIEGFEVAHAANGEDALERAATLAPDLVILDLMLPGISGETVLRSLRARGSHAPVLILSARREELDKVHGFRMGADDYVTKPFGLLELLARVHALLRRIPTHPNPTPPRGALVTCGSLVFDVGGNRILRDGKEVAVRPKERDLLFALLDHAGTTVSRHRLLRDVWGYAPGVDSRTVDWHIAELRRKLDDDATHPVLIRTVRKVGYCLMLDPSAGLLPDAG